MPFLQPQTVSRTNVAHHETISFDSGRGKQGFFHPSSQWFGWEEIPHDNAWTDGSPSFMAPVPHFHLLQIERFYIASGSGYWYMCGQKHKLSKGDTIDIPRFVGHRFESIPNEAEEPLVIWYRYDAQMWEMEERFFRNMLTYLDDCRKAKVEPNLMQICIFLADCWMPPDVIPFPGGDYLRCAVNTLFMWIMAAIGMLLYGYKRSYVEYYDPEFSRRRIMAEGAKGK
ncbi:Hypothetical protein D9617_15g043390 [Elsinoe fawcettii]|nr:Hypothetical protein D9617_15g043390 [Elsinoe fawcettii]